MSYSSSVSIATATTRKQALGPPQKYRYGDELVPMLHTGTFGVDEIFEWALGTGWYYQPVPKALHRYRVVPPTGAYR